MLDIRLDYIEKISLEAVETMKCIRKDYIAMDKKLALMGDDAFDLEWLSKEQRQSIQRTVALARTNLEMSLQYAIKSLAQLGEIKTSQQNGEVTE